MLLLLALVVISIATWAIVDIVHHGQIFADFRAVLDLRPDWWLSKMVRCPWCLSVNVAMLLSFILALPLLRISGWGLLLSVVGTVLIGFAASKVANFLNDISYTFTRLPKGIPADESKDAKPENS